MTTAANTHTDKETTSYNANSEEHKGQADAHKGRGKGKSGDEPQATGKPIEEMTHAEHKAYLIREAEENERVNDEIYKRTVDDIPSTAEVQLPREDSNDLIRAKALEQTEAIVAASTGNVKRVPYRKDGKDPDDPNRDKPADKDKAK